MTTTPLPAPDQLASYPPEARELIYRMAEAAQAHQHRLELEQCQIERDELATRANDRRAQRRQIARGQYLGFGICVLSLLAGLAIALATQTWSGHLAGGFVSVFGLSGLAYVFIRGRHPARSRPGDAIKKKRAAAPLLAPRPLQSN